MENFDGNNLLQDVDLIGYQTVSRVGRRTVSYDSTIVDDNEIFSMLNVQMIFMPIGIVITEDVFGQMTFKSPT